MVEVGPSGHTLWQSSDVRGCRPLASARVGPEVAQIQGGTPLSSLSLRDMQLRGVRIAPKQLTSLTALPDFVSMVPVRLPFPSLPPRPPKRAGSADSHASSDSGSHALPSGQEISTRAASKSVEAKKIQLSCEAWLQTPVSRRLYIGVRLSCIHLSLKGMRCCNSDLSIMT